MTTPVLTTELRGVSREAVQALSEAKQEPQWLRQRRLDALTFWDQAPMPSREDEAWRRTDLGKLRLNQLAPFTLSEITHGHIGDLSEELNELLQGVNDQAGLLVQVEGTSVMHRQDETTIQQGVVFCSLDQAVRNHPDLVQRYLETVVPANAGKFESLNAALWSGGAFIYVPQGVTLQLPLHAVVHSNHAGMISTRTLIVAEPNAEVTVIEEFLSATTEGTSLNAGVVEVLALDGARVTFVNIQQWGRHTWNLVTQKSKVGRDATVNTVNVATGARLHRAAIELSLEGRGASGRIWGMVFGDLHQHFDHQTLQDHLAPNTSSDSLFKTALTDSSRSVAAGLIRIAPEAQGTEAFLESRNMLLSDKARADSIPGLEILANDVRCKHAATVGRIDEEQLFYLMSRGVDRDTAESLIVAGFFAPVIDRVPMEWLRNKLTATLARRLELAHEHSRDPAGAARG